MERGCRASALLKKNGGGGGGVGAAKDSSPECWGWGKKLLDITQGILKGYSRDIKR